MGKTGRHDWRAFLKLIRSRYRLWLLLSGLLIYWFSLPEPLFDKPLSFILEDKNGQLLGAKIAGDGQWRFPPPDSLPHSYTTALIAFEDKRFYKHPGVDPISLARAFYQNIRAGQIVSGGSTIHMQVMRLALENRRRNLPNKIREMILATRLALSHSTEEILRLYATNAPFGGNVVGIEAASWRYFNKAPTFLSWAEAAMLAVLPNSPGLIHPGKNRDLLLQKRNRLLQKLRTQGSIDTLTLELALAEPLPDEVHALPRIAPHLLEQAYASHYPQQHRIRSSIDFNLQKGANAVVRRHHEILKVNQIHNLAALILDIRSGLPLVYIGNVQENNAGHQEQVDIIQSSRSSGSILKPLLAAWMMQEGMLIPQSLISDVPTNINGYQPENFTEQYDGLISVEKAIAKSLNIPFVRMLQQYGVEKFYHKLKKVGISSLNFPASHYGLTLVLGGAEVNLADVCQAYAGIARSLRYFVERNSRYAPGDFEVPLLFEEKKNFSDQQLQDNPPVIAAAPSWFALQAMQQLERPNDLGYWQRFSSAQQIAWKTGTSFGFKDAWAIGLNRDYVIGVWAGNADGEGRPGLTGIKAAAPVLFELFDLLPVGNWFDTPWDDMRQLDICSTSGYRAGKDCPSERQWVPQNATQLAKCLFHQTVFLSTDEQYRLHLGCASAEEMHAGVIFEIPPLESYYYRTKNPQYRPAPPFRPDCLESGQTGTRVMELIYPKNNTQIYVPLDLSGQPSRTVFEVAHQIPGKTVFWHLDEVYIGATRDFHTIELNPKPGRHYLTLVDEDGNRLVCKFEILEKK